MQNSTRNHGNQCKLKLCHNFSSTRKRKRYSEWQFSHLHLLFYIQAFQDGSSKFTWWCSDFLGLFSRKYVNKLAIWAFKVYPCSAVSVFYKPKVNNNKGHYLNALCISKLPMVSKSWKKKVIDFRPKSLLNLNLYHTFYVNVLKAHKSLN